MYNLTNLVYDNYVDSSMVHKSLNINENGKLLSFTFECIIHIEIKLIVPFF